MILARLYLMLPPEARRTLAMWMVDLSVLGLCISPFFPKLALTIVLDLSWFAITLTALDWLTTSDVRHQQKGKR